MEMGDLNEKNPSVKGFAKELKRCSSSSSSSILPLELLIEILCRLPSKTLCKFRCVSKQWLRLLSSDPQFSSLHRRRSLSNPPFFLFCTLSTSSDESFALRLASFDASGRLRDDFCSHTPFSAVRTVISCCNLVCIVCCCGDIYVCNPSTRALAQLPNSPNAGNVETLVVAFGVLPSAAHYKIVRFFDTHCEVFSLVDGGGVGSGSWRKIGISPVYVYRGSTALCVDGFVYIITDFDGSKSGSLLSLDLERERFGMVSYPQIVLSCTFMSWSRLSLVELNGFVCLVGDCLGSEADIWMLVDRENSVWVKQYSIDYSGLGSRIQLLFCIAPEGEVQKLLVSINDYKLYYYNPKSMNFKRLKICHGPRSCCCVYYDGLFSLGSK